MRSARNAGRVLGVLLFLQLAGLMVPFMLIARPIATGDFMAEAAASSTARAVRSNSLPKWSTPSVTGST